MNRLSPTDWRTLFLKLWTCSGLFALMVMVLGTLIYALGLGLTADQLRTGFLFILPGCALIVMAGGGLALHRQLADLRRYAKDEVKTRKKTAHALVQVLNLPQLAAMRVIFVQGPLFMISVTIFTQLGNRWFDLGFQPWQLYTCLAGAVVVAFGHAIVEYSAWRQILLPFAITLDRQTKGLPLNLRAKMFRLQIRRKLLLVFLFSILAPLIALDITVPIRIPEAKLAASLINWMVIITITAFIGALIAGASLASEIGRAIDFLAQALQRVQRGKLNVRIPEVSNDEFFNVESGVNETINGLRERRRLFEALGRYISPELAEEIAHKGLRLEARRLRCAILYLDIRGFTHLAEKIGTEAVFTLLNRFFSAIYPVIEKEGGWINKYGGDSVLAVFGFPKASRNPSAAAVRAALGLRKCLSDFNAQEATRSGERLAIGIGITAGEVVVGNLGSEQKPEFTVIGDAVNLATRIEELNKEWGTDILVSQEVRKQAPHHPWKAMPAVPIRGHEKPVVTCALT